MIGGPTTLTLERLNQANAELVKALAEVPKPRT